MCQSDHRSSVRANESLYGCHSFNVMCTESVFILRPVTCPAWSPARSALWFSQHKNKLTNQPKENLQIRMGIRRGSSQSWAVLSTERGYTVSPDRARSLVSLWCLLEKKPFSSWFPSISWNRKLKTDEGWKRCSVCDSVTRLQICRDDSHRLPWWRLLRAKWSRETYWSRNRCRYECVI